MTKNNENLLIINARILTPQQMIENGSVLIQNGKIVKISSGPPDHDLSEAFVRTVDAEGAYLIPGFVDIHVHGGGGFDVISAAEDPSVINALSRYHATKGTTSYLPTTLTAERSLLEQTIRGIVTAMNNGTEGAEVVGIHLEGPYINPMRCGAQNPKHIRAGTMEEMRCFVELAEGTIRLITLAPEMPGAKEIMAYARREGITIAIGHSDAGFEVVNEAVAQGASHVTHLFNGMSPLHHREPGVAGSALMLDELAVELICDGIHMSRELIPFVFQVKPRDKVILITDAVAPAGCANGEYVLGDLEVILNNGQVNLKQGGALAGSCLTMDQALRNAMQFTGKPLADILPALTINPATQVNLQHRKGSIEVGKDADLVILDENYNVRTTFVKGKKVYEAI